MNALDFLPRVLPPGWSEVRCPVPGARAFVYELGQPRSVIVSVERHENDREWLHLSLAGRTALPSWDALKEARRLFLGDRAVVQFLPRDADWVNVHDNALHLWAPVDGVWPADFWAEGNAC